MNGWDELLDRLTDRLRVDEELRLDVAQELRAHLEDSAAEFRRAGQDQQEAADSAAAALGDERELAEMLWTANRRRIRLRGVLRWVARVTLLPAAVLVIVFLLVSMGGKSYPMHMGQLFDPGWASRFMGLLGKSYWSDALTEEERFILTGDPAAKDRIERAKSIADRWPDNPVYYGNYVVNLMTSRDLYERDDAGKVLGFTPEGFARMLTVMDRGERIDPDNAFYDFFKASWLVKEAATLSEDPARTYEVTCGNGEVTTVHCDRIEIHDPDQFRRGLEEFRQGLAKAEWTGRTMEMTNLRLGLLPEPDRLSEYLRRLALQYSVLLPRFNDYRLLADRLGQAHGRQAGGKEPNTRGPACRRSHLRPCLDISRAGLQRAGPGRAG